MISPPTDLIGLIIFLTLSSSFYGGSKSGRHDDKRGRSGPKESEALSEGMGVRVKVPSLEEEHLYLVRYFFG